MLKKVLFAALVMAGFIFGQREKVSFDDGWLFYRCGDMPDGSQLEEPAELQAPEADDSAWRRLSLPHDWAIEGPFRADLPNNTGKLPFTGIGWYRKHFTAPTGDEGRQLYVMFDGAMSDAKVWLNGELLGRCPYGYSSFYFDISDNLNYGGENVMAVRLDNKPDSSRWYPGAGIYRHTWLIKTSPLHKAIWGTFISTPKVSTELAAIKIETELANNSNKNAELALSYRIINSAGETVAMERTRDFSLAAGARANKTIAVAIENPQLWSVEAANLYTLKTNIVQGEETIETSSTRFGVRSVAFTPQGFLLNGRPCELNGVCMHHDLGPLGSAMNKSALARQLGLLKEMGANAIRTSHNMPAPELLELCDEMGLLVLDEAFDCWKNGKLGNDYHRFFDEWHEFDITNFVKRDRNHPCVFLWSSGNEVIEQRKGKDGQEISRKLRKLFHKLDPTRMVTVGCDAPDSGFNGFQNTVDVFGFNYKPHLYERFAKENPKQPFFASESASCVSSRGEYFFPVNQDQAKGSFDFQVSSYDLYAPGWATKPDVEFEGQDKVPACAGEFVWTGFDYIGEPTPYNEDISNLLNFQDEEGKKKMLAEMEALGGRVPSRSSYFGILDLCGFPKDRFYLYQARWRPELPMAHILPHWNWQEMAGKNVPVHVYSSGDEAELFLNGKSLGRKKRGEFEYRFVWEDVIYESGRLEAVVYKNGAEWARDVMETTGPAQKLTLSAYKNPLEQGELAFVTVRISDAEGRLVPRTHNLVRFEVDGGEIAALGNGNPASHEPFLASERKAFNGLCLAVVRPIGAGKITLKATSEGLAGAEIELQCK